MNAGRQAVRTPFGANAGGKGRIVALRSHLSVTTPRTAPPTVRGGPGQARAVDECPDRAIPIGRRIISGVRFRIVLPDRLAGSSCRIVLPDRLAGSSCRIVLPDRLAGSPCRIALPDRLAGSSCWIARRRPARQAVTPGSLTPAATATARHDPRPRPSLSPSSFSSRPERSRPAAAAHSGRRSRRAASLPCPSSTTYSGRPDSARRTPTPCRRTASASR